MKTIIICVLLALTLTAPAHAAGHGHISFDWLHQSEEGTDQEYVFDGVGFTVHHSVTERWFVNAGVHMQQRDNFGDKDTPRVMFQSGFRFAAW